jgi:secondary thiamine-phosphate synthase enzyme
MSALDFTQHRHFTFIAVLVLAVCLFPGFPQYLLAAPYRLLVHSIKSSPAPVLVPSRSVGCAPINKTSNMAWFQKTFTLPPKSRGSYLITDQVVSSLPEIKDYKVGLLNLFVQHTSCALSLNENWDSDVREDMSDALDRIAPEDRKGNLYRHSAEGLDDMPVSASRILR